MKKLFLISISSAVGLVLGVVVTVLFGLAFLSYSGIGPFSDDGFAVAQIKIIENKLGESCRSIHDGAQQVISHQLSALRTATEEERRWVIEDRDEVIKKLKAMTDKVAQCEMAQISAKKGNVYFSGDYHKLNALIGELLVEIRGIERVSSEILNTYQSSILEILEQKYRDLTVQSKADAR